MSLYLGGLYLINLIGTVFPCIVRIAKILDILDTSHDHARSLGWFLSTSRNVTPNVPLVSDYVHIEKLLYILYMYILYDCVNILRYLYIL